jgi:hypothetical protein
VVIKHSLATRIRLELFRRLKYQIFMFSGLARARSLASKLRSNDDPVLVVVGFNDARLITVQLQALEEHATFPFTYIVADNSTTREGAEAIRSALRDTRAEYIRLPKNWFSNSRGAAKPGRGSLSHSVALDWIWKRVLVPARPSFIALLDHDVFPTQPFDIAATLGEKIAVGPPRFGSTRWTLWPGLSLFRFDLLPRTKISFMPSGDLDSGAGLWHSLIERTDPSRLGQLSRRFLLISEGNHPAKDELEMIDESWLHLGDGSGWFDGTSKVEELISYAATNGQELPEEILKVVKLLESSPG